MNREGTSLVLILAGIVVIIGAAKGTWRQVWYDLTGNSVSGGGGGGSSGNTPNGIQTTPGLNIPLPGGHGVQIGGGFNPLIPSLPIIVTPYALPYTPAPGTSGNPVAQVS